MRRCTGHRPLTRRGTARTASVPAAISQDAPAQQEPQRPSPCFLGTAAQRDRTLPNQLLRRDVDQPDMHRRDQRRHLVHHGDRRRIGAHLARQLAPAAVAAIGRRYPRQTTALRRQVDGPIPARRGELPRQCPGNDRNPLRPLRIARLAAGVGDLDRETRPQSAAELRPRMPQPQAEPGRSPPQ